MLVSFASRLCPIPPLPGAGPSVKVGIHRPQFTIMVRFLMEIGHYLRSFAPPPDPSVPEPAPAARFEPLPKETEESPKAPAARRSTIEIDLTHPVLIFPRSSRSRDAWVTDLGRIQAHSAPEGVWAVAFEAMKLEIGSEAGGKSVMAERVDGEARVLRPEGDSQPGIRLKVDIHEVVGSITDMQYALLMCIIGENVGESRVARLGGPLAQLSGGTAAGLSFEDLGSLCETAISAAAACVPVMRITVTVRTTALDLAIARDLQMLPEERTALLRASCTGLQVEYEIMPPARAALSGDASDGLFWRFIVRLPGLTLVDNRPAMAARALSLLTVTASQQLSSAAPKADNEGCLCLEFVKTRQFHLSLHITAQPVRYPPPLPTFARPILAVISADVAK